MLINSEDHESREIQTRRDRQTDRQTETCTQKEKQHKQTNTSIRTDRHDSKDTDKTK